VIASIATYPFIVLRTIMQDYRTAENERLISMIEVFQDIYKKQGIKGFYAGIKPDLLRLLPSNTIVFLVY
jgi:solute carrier family 25 folate transporter 32